MKTTKLNIGLSLSRNYDKVTLEMIEEKIEYVTDDDLRAKVRHIFNVLRAEVELEFTKIQK